jgi:hypothetical protein
MTSRPLPRTRTRYLVVLAVGFALALAGASPASAGIGDGGGGGGGGGSTGGGNQPDYHCVTSTVTAQDHTGTRTERYTQGYHLTSRLHMYQMPFFGKGPNCPHGGFIRGWTTCPSGMDVWRFYATGNGTSYQVQYFAAAQSHSQVNCDPRWTNVQNSQGAVFTSLNTVYTYPSPDDAGTAGRPFRFFQNTTWNSGPGVTSSLGTAPFLMVPNRPHATAGSTRGLASSPNLVQQMLQNPASRDEASRAVFDMYSRFRDAYGRDLAAAHANLTAPPASAADVARLYDAGRTPFASPFDLVRDPADRTQVLYGVCYMPREVPARVMELPRGGFRASPLAYNTANASLIAASSQRYVSRGAANDAAARAIYGDGVVNDVRNRIQTEVASRSATGPQRVGRALTAAEWSTVKSNSYPGMPAVNQAQAAAQARQQATCLFGMTSSSTGGEELLTPQIPVRGDIGVVGPNSFTVQGTFGEGVIRTSISTNPDCGRMPCAPAPTLVSVRFNPRLVSSDPTRYQVCEGTYREGCGAVVTSTRTVRSVRGVPVEVEIRAQFYNATPNGVTLRIDTSDARTVWQPYQIRRVCEAYLDWVVIEPGSAVRRPVLRENCYDVVLRLPQVTLTPDNGIRVTGNDPRLVVRSIVTR